MTGSENYDDIPEYHIDTMDLDNLINDMAEPICTVDTENEIIMEANARNVPPVRVAFDLGFPVIAQKWWRTPVVLDDNDLTYTGLNLMGASRNVLTDFAKAVATTMQFRVDSVYLHGLGVVSSAMVKNFRYLRFGIPKPPGLYTISSQPSGAGKSGVNGYLVDPVRRAVDEHNDHNEPKREEIKLRLDGLIKERAGKKCSTAQRVQLGIDIKSVRDELEPYAKYVYGVNDATPEGLEEKCVAVNNGVFTVVSDEAEAITVLIGANYSEGNANLGIMLSGWEGGHQHSLRTGRDGYYGYVYGAIAVLAQKSVIDAILSAGRGTGGGGSRGAAERFLAISEPDNFDNMDAHTYTPIDIDAKHAYTETIRNIFLQDPVELEFSLAGIHELNTVKARLINMVKTGGRYNDPFMQSVAIKGDVQVAKIATVLHALENWKPHGNRAKVIDVEHIRQAEHTFFQCLKSFEVAADERGVAGKKTEINALIKKFKSMAQDKKYWAKPVKTANFCDSVKTNSPFKGKQKVVSFIKSLLPELERLNYIVYDKAKDEIFINPMLRD